MRTNYLVSFSFAKTWLGGDGSHIFLLNSRIQMKLLFPSLPPKFAKYLLPDRPVSQNQSAETGNGIVNIC